MFLKFSENDKKVNIKGLSHSAKAKRIKIKRETSKKVFSFASDFLLVLVGLFKNWFC